MEHFYNIYKKMFEIVHSQSLPTIQFVKVERPIIPQNNDLIKLNISNSIATYHSQINIRNKMGNQKVNIILHLFLQRDKPQEIFHYILHILYFFIQWKPANCSRQLTIELYLTNYKKKLPPTKYKNLTTNETNNAFTTSCAENTNITIYRKEEWKKVLIHEIFHCYGLDFSANNLLVQYAKQQLQKLFHIHSTFQFYESFCETNANLLFICYNLCLLSKKPFQLTQFENKMEEFVATELKHSIQMTKLIFSHFGISFRNLISGVEIPIETYEEILNEQNNNLIVYFFIRTIFLFYCKNYLQLWLGGNGGQIAFFQTKGNINRFLSLVQRGIQDTKYIGAFENEPIPTKKYLRMFSFDQLK